MEQVAMVFYLHFWPDISTPDKDTIHGQNYINTRENRSRDGLYNTLLSDIKPFSTDSKATWTIVVITVIPYHNWCKKRTNKHVNPPYNYKLKVYHNTTPYTNILSPTKVLTKLHRHLGPTTAREVYSRFYRSLNLSSSFIILSCVPMKVSPSLTPQVTPTPPHHHHKRKGNREI